MQLCSTLILRSSRMGQEVVLDMNTECVLPLSSIHHLLFVLYYCVTLVDS